MIISTDMECDDTNGILLTLLFSNDLDIAGLVLSAGTCHWQGDGEHTIGEINPDHTNSSIGADALTEWRGVPDDAIEKLILENYAADYEFLVQNDPNYPSPEELLAVTKVGNNDFEGDVRFDTEGSDLIRAAMLDDDMRPLFVQSWGGFNTVCRALLSIYEEYKETEEWDAVYNKICEKVYLMGTGEDTAYLVNGIEEKFPDIKTYWARGNGGFENYNGWQNSEGTDLEKYYRGEWLYDNWKTGHGSLLARELLMHDGSMIYGNEPDCYQFGQLNTVDFGYKYNVEENVWFKNTTIETPIRNDYDWCCMQFGEWSFIPVGLRGLEVPNYGTWAGQISINGEAVNRAGEYAKSDLNFTQAMFLETANRGKWATAPYEDCNHAPVVTAEEYDIYANPGETVTIRGAVTEPDGDEYTCKWWVYREASEYDGDKAVLGITSADTLETEFTVPSDAVSGDYFNLVMTVNDSVEQPMERYAQVIVHVQ